MTDEVWKPIPGYEGLYEASSLGRIRSLDKVVRSARSRSGKRTRRGRILQTSVSNKGREHLTLWKDGHAKTMLVHRLVAAAFLGPSSLTVNHRDENPLNNSVENLEWCTSKYNNLYSSYKRRNRIEAYTVDGELLATFESEYVAAQMLGVTKSAISQAISGAHGTCLGLVFKLKE